MQRNTLLALSAALLGTTCLVSPVAAANSVTVNGAAGVSATNFGPVNATIPAIGAATITTSVLGTIGASGTGAAAGDNIDQAVGPGPAMNLTTLPANSIIQTTPGANSTGANHATVNASVTITGNATINATSFDYTAGVGNTIGAQSVGGSAVASIGSRFANVGTSATGTPSSNLIDLGANLLTATNDAAITVNQVTIGGNALINSGQSNTIGGSAAGATAGATISQAAVESRYNTLSMDLTSLPTNRINAGNISATNAATGSVDVYTTPVQISGSATIQNGIGNSIAAQAVGASAGAGISSQFEFVRSIQSPTTTVSTNVVGVGTVTATNFATVWAKETVGGPALISVSGLPNTGNAIGATAAGASASASISQAVAGPASFNPTRLPSNSVTTGNMGAFNHAGAEVAARLSSGNATISGGMDNSIAAQAVGASVSASIVTRNDTWNNGYDPYGAAPSFNTINPSGNPTLTAQNDALVDSAYTIAGNAQIAAGVGNNIGASAIGASAGASITQSARNAGSGMSPSDFPTNAVHVGDVSATNTNTGTIDISAYLPVSVSGLATIDGGLGNSIAAQGVGASAGASVSSKFDLLQIAPGVLPPFGVPPALSSNTVTTGALTATNSATVTTRETITGAALIANGVGNTIGASAIGASASAGIAQSVSKSNAAITDNLKVLPTNLITTGNILAANSAQVYATLSEGANASIGNGIDNSIGAQAAGASASAQISSRFDAVSTTISSLGAKSFNTIDPQTLTAVNNPGGVVLANVTIGGNAVITNGVGNRIGASAFGASAGAGIAQSASNVGLSGGFDLTTVPNNGVTAGDVSATNLAKVDVTTHPFVVTGSATITDGVSNAIAGQAVGSSAGASISSNVYGLMQTAGPLNGSPSTNAVITGNLLSSNFSPVTSTVNIGTTAAIGGGVSNSVVATAVGASGGASIDQSVSSSSGALNLASLPSNSVTTGFIVAGNNGAAATVAATLTVGGGSTTIPGGMSNSIGSRATGSAGQASISSQFAYLETTTGGAPSTNSVSTGFITSTNGSQVQAQTTLGTAGFGNAVSINGGIGNSIGASATGASALSSINQIAYNSTGAGIALATLPTNGVTTGNLSSTNSGATSATLTLLGTAPSATIGGGIGNSIAASAVGASAGASITQHISGVTTLP